MDNAPQGVGFLGTREPVPESLQIEPLWQVDDVSDLEGLDRLFRLSVYIFVEELYLAVDSSRRAK